MVRRQLGSSSVTSVSAIQLRPSVLMAGWWGCFVYVWGCFACICVCTVCSHGAWEGRKRASDPLQLEMEVGWSCRVCCELDPSLYSKSLYDSEMSCMWVPAVVWAFLFHTVSHTDPMGMTVNFTGALVLCPLSIWLVRFLASFVSTFNAVSFCNNSFPRFSF